MNCGLGSWNAKSHLWSFYESWLLLLTGNRKPYNNNVLIIHISITYTLI